MEDYSVGQILFVLVSIIVIFYAGYIKGFIKGRIDALASIEFDYPQNKPDIKKVEIFVEKVDGEFLVYRSVDNRYIGKVKSYEDLEELLISVDPSILWWISQENMNKLQDNE